MPAPVPFAVRQAIIRRHRRGATPAAIADALGLPARTVRHLLARYRRQGEAALAPAYPRGPRPRPRAAERARDRAVALRRDHPTWGAGLIRLHLRPPGGRRPPAARTLQRWFRRAGLGPAPRGRRPAAAAPGARAGRPHDVWQVDAKEQVRLRTGQRVSWLRVVDECSGAVLWTAVFPPRVLAQGPAGGRPGRTAAGVRPLGPAGGHPGR
jgi:transposase